MTVQHSLRRQGNWDTADTSALAERVEPLLGTAGTGHSDFNRREMLTYAWAGTLAVMTLGSGLAAYQFLYPRRPVNEFGGTFHLGTAELPPIDSDPKANVDGRFWLVNTEKGPRALYNVCTHNWDGSTAKYNWQPARNRFECPVCGAKFSREGHYISGPAPRSLDQFLIEIVMGRAVLAKTNFAGEVIEAPGVPSLETEIVIDTGKILEGLSSGIGP